MQDQTSTANLLEAQRRFFASHRTLDVGFRIEQLHKLKTAIKKHEADLLDALNRDLHKSAFEAYTSEIGFAYAELNATIAHLRRWAKPLRAKTPALLWPSSSRIYAEPKGVVLIIGPWNYPIQLLLSPLIGAIAAGNCVIIKPSEVASASQNAAAKLIADTFASDYCAVVCGDATTSQDLLAHRFDHIFFTGSSIVGRQVLKAAAEHLTPVTLELGGKSPCVVDADTNLKITARRIAWGKFYNAGQTCVAPDYVLVQHQVKDALIQQIKDAAVEMFGAQSQNSPDYGRIINDKHFARLQAMLDGQKILCGGETDRASRFIGPTLIEVTDPQNAAVREEIFGPILPIIAYGDEAEVFAHIAKHPNPLACYVFTNRDTFAQRLIHEVRFGGGCINNTLVHVANHCLPFGGIGTSGMGAYHGKASFDLFSHKKSVMRTPWFFDPWLKYPPYGNRLALVRKIMR